MFILSILTGLHIVTAILLIIVVLLQSGKGSDISGLFGGGSSQSLFGATGGKTVLTKITTVLAIVFMCTSLLLAVLPNKPGFAQTGVSDLQKEMLKETEGQKNQPQPMGPVKPVTPERK